MTDSTILDSFEWPAEVSVVALGRAIAAARGLILKLNPIPERLNHYELSGLTAVTGTSAYVFYSPTLSPLNRDQTLLHEYAHILHGDVRADTDCTHQRNLGDDRTEARAEATGTLLLKELQRRREIRTRPLPATVIGFVTGNGTKGLVTSPRAALEAPR